jgi:hypothetical protein
VVNLAVQNNALLLKQLDKFHTKADVQWVSLIWHKYYQNEIPHLAREKGFFGGRTFSDFIFFTEVLRSACPLGETLLLSGRMLSMEI